MKITAVIMALLLVLSCFGCEGEGARTERDSAPETSAPAANSHEDGGDFNILSRSGEDYLALEMGLEFDTGNRVDSAIFQRERSTEDKFSVKIENEAVSDKRYFKKLKSSVASGEHGYDLSAGYMLSVVPHAAEGLYHDLTDEEGLKLDSPWWNRDTLSHVISDKLYFASGDIVSSYIYNIEAMICNTEALDFDIEAVVREGAWTFERMLSASKGFYSDINGNNATDIDDRLGYASNYIMAYSSAFESDIARIEPDGRVELSLYSNDFVLRYRSLLELYRDRSVFPTLTENSALERAFSDGRLLFWGTVLADFDGCEYYLGGDCEIIPFPKYDEAQSEYQTVPHDYFSVISIPRSAANASVSAEICEYMARYGYEYITPEIVIELTNAENYIRGKDNGILFDVILSGIRLDAGYFYASSLASLPIMCYSQIYAGNGNIGDYYRTYEKDLKTRARILENLYSYIE